MVKLLKYLIAFLLSLLVIEMFLTMAEISPPFLTEFDQKMGLVPKKDLNYVKFKEGFFIGKSNQYGRYRDNYLKQKDLNTIRIGIVGDSFVEGLDVLSRNHFSGVIEQELGKNISESKIEVLNFGRGNFGLPLSYYYFKNHAKDFELDYVVYFVARRDYVLESAATKGMNSSYYTYKDSLVTNNEWKKSSIYTTLKKMDSVVTFLNYKDVALLTMSKRVKDMFKVKSPWKFILGKFCIGCYDLDFAMTDKRMQCRKGSEYTSKISKGSKFILEELIEGPIPTFIVLRSFPCETSQLKNFLDSSKAKYFDIQEIFPNGYEKETGIDVTYFKATSSYGGHFNNYGHKVLGKQLAGRIESDIFEIANSKQSDE